jgi:hypothetical protein
MLGSNETIAQTSPESSVVAVLTVKVSALDTIEHIRVLVSVGVLYNAS